MTTTRSQRTGPPPPRPAAPQDTSPADEILAAAQSSRTVIQDFVPLAESLEWNLGQEYLRDRGVKAFISDFSPVPWVVNNDGTLSYRAAELFYTSLVEADRAGALPPGQAIYALELGIGVGLFARFFLDAFRELCWKNDKDYYDRFCYVAADRSGRMLTDLCRHGVLGNHLGHYCVRQVDALEPDSLLKDALFAGAQGPPLHAVFLNYLLDCLPAAVLQIDGDSVDELYVKTVVARGIHLPHKTDLTAAQLKERAKYTDADSYRELLECYQWFAFEYDYRAADLQTLPLADFALNLARGRTKYFLHSYGAIQCLERLMRVVQPRGFILANDYGSDSLQMEHAFEHQRFSLATFVGVNFAELGQWFDPSPFLPGAAPDSGNPAGRYYFEAPGGDEPSIHSRLLMRRDEEILALEGGTPKGTNSAAAPPIAATRPTYRTRVRFSEVFGPGEQLRLLEPIAKARLNAQYGRFEIAADEYREARQRQPYNWVLLSEMANFFIHHYRGDQATADPQAPQKQGIYGGIKAGIDLAKLALAQNPTCSAELWSVLGDGLFDYGRYAEARSAYQKALAVNDKDVRARFNLAYVFVREGDFPAAMMVIAEALALDKLGQYHAALWRKLQEAVTLQDLRHRQEYLQLMNLVSRHAPVKPVDKPGAEAERQPEAPPAAEPQSA